MLGQEKVKPRDVLIGVGSSGLHSNGYSLARRVCFEEQSWTPETLLPELSTTIGDALLAPTRIYVKLVKALLAKEILHGVAHITGGGLTGNVPRIYSNNCQAVIDRTQWAPPPLFSVLQQAGHIERGEMYRVFNMGIGLVLVCHQENVTGVMDVVTEQGLPGFRIGEIRQRSTGAVPLVYAN